MQEVSGSIPLTSTKIFAEICRDGFELVSEHFCGGAKFIRASHRFRKFPGYDPIV
jgi:hypothetical protein